MSVFRGKKIVLSVAIVKYRGQRPLRNTARRPILPPLAGVPCPGLRDSRRERLELSERFRVKYFIAVVKFIILFTCKHDLCVIFLSGIHRLNRDKK